MYSGKCNNQIEKPFFVALIKPVFSRLGPYCELTQFVVHPNFRAGDVSLTIFNVIDQFCLDHLIEHIIFKSSESVSRLNSLTLTRLNKLNNRNHTIQAASQFKPPKILIEKYRGLVTSLNLFSLDLTNDKTEH